VSELAVSIKGIKGLATSPTTICLAVKDSELELLPCRLRGFPAHWAVNHLDPILILIIFI
jgi:hypothetical protein